VVRERTRLIEREEFKKGDVSGLRMAGSSSRAKGKNKARDVGGFVGRPELDDEKLRVRYKEAVDEKKGIVFFRFWGILFWLNTNGLFYSSGSAG